MNDTERDGSKRKKDSKGNPNFYDEESVDNVKFIYIISIVIWVILICILQMYITDYIGILILFIPIVIFIISFVSFKSCQTDIEDEIFQYDILAFGVVIVTVFLSLGYPEYSSYFYRLIFVGILLMGLSMIDVWVSRRFLIVHKHIRGILQTMATTIFIYLFYSFYYLAARTSVAHNPFTGAIDLHKC